MLMLILYGYTDKFSGNSYFNTSHVNVNRLKYGSTAQMEQYFNTSHVNVNQYKVVR